MDIEEAKKCKEDKTPVRISGSYLFDTNTTHITYVDDTAIVPGVQVSGSDELYELTRLYKYTDLSDPEQDFEDDGAYAD